MLNAIVSYIAVASLAPAPRNARRHSKRQISKLARIIKEFGFLVPVLAAKDGRIVAGHARVEAAKLLAMTHVPVIYVEHLSSAQIEALALAENRIGDESSFSEETLALIVQDLATVADFDLTLTAFDTGELDMMLAEPADEDAPEPEPDRSKVPTAKVGDVFKIGEHRIVCGDARDDVTFELLLGSELARATIDDFPYNVKINGHVSSTGHHAEFPMAAGEMSPTEFTAFIAAVSARLVAHSGNGSLHYLFMDHRHLRELLDGTAAAFDEHINLCCWVKPNGGLGSLYRSRHELIFVLKAGKAAHINNVQLGKHGRNRSNVWEYGGANSFGKNRMAMLEQHATSKPVALISDAILDCTNRGDIVLDAFLGSGTTIIACERTGRRGRGIELDPHLVDVAVQRVERVVGVPAIHIETGKSFAQLTHARRNPGWSLSA